MASLPRRSLLTAAGALALVACRPGATARMTATPKFDLPRLNRDVGAIAARLEHGALGVGLMDLESGEVFAFNGARPFPMQSVFKAPLAAAVLAEADARRLSLAERITLGPMDLSAAWSPIADAWPARRDYAVGDLVRAAVVQSDNTAADVLMARVGGPGAVTAWLTSKRIDEIRIDRYEREIQTEIFGLASFRPEWRNETAFRAALATVPPARQRQAMTDYLSDLRDTATPTGMLQFLDALDDGLLLSPASTRRLLALMGEVKTGPRRILAALPKGSALAHKTGTGPANLGTTSAINDAGILTLPDKRKYSLAIFVAGATLPPAACEDLIAEVARALLRGVR